MLGHGRGSATRSLRWSLARSESGQALTLPGAVRRPAGGQPRSTPSAGPDGGRWVSQPVPEGCRTAGRFVTSDADLSYASSRLSLLRWRLFLGLQRSPVAHLVRSEEARGSDPLSSTRTTGQAHDLKLR